MFASFMFSITGVCSANAMDGNKEKSTMVTDINSVMDVLLKEYFIIVKKNYSFLAGPVSQASLFFKNVLMNK